MTKLNCDMESSVPDWVIEYPQSLSVFQELGIDYSCGGKSLEYACQQRGLDVEYVMSKLLAIIAATPRSSGDINRDGQNQN